jgi:hypothetical protein
LHIIFRKKEERQKKKNHDRMRVATSSVLSVDFDGLQRTERRRLARRQGQSRTARLGQGGVPDAGDRGRRMGGGSSEEFNGEQGRREPLQAVAWGTTRRRRGSPPDRVEGKVWPTERGTFRVAAREPIQRRRRAPSGGGAEPFSGVAGACPVAARALNGGRNRGGIGAEGRALVVGGDVDRRWWVPNWVLGAATR